MFSMKQSRKINWWYFGDINGIQLDSYSEPQPFEYIIRSDANDVIYIQFAHITLYVNAPVHGVCINRDWLLFIC